MALIAGVFGPLTCTSTWRSKAVQKSGQGGEYRLAEIGDRRSSGVFLLSNCIGNLVFGKRNLLLPNCPPTRTDTLVMTTGTALQPLSWNTSGITEEHMGTWIVPWDPYETSAPNEPQLLGSASEATTQENFESNI